MQLAIRWSGLTLHLHQWYTEKGVMASSYFFVCNLPLGHAVHAPHGSAIAVDTAVGWRINPWWGRSTWGGASSFQFHIAGLRVFFSHSRSSVLYVTVWILVHLCHTTNTRLYRFVVLSSGILGIIIGCCQIKSILWLDLDLYSITWATCSLNTSTNLSLTVL